MQVRPYTNICNSNNNCRKEKYIAHTESTENTEIVSITLKARGVIAHTESTENTEIVSITLKARGVIAHTE
ncbi:MAG: hypothetical protein IKH22_11230, partial [Prevotella sp.]|nr:hypothetical protein [Prevotella sp.]